MVKHRKVSKYYETDCRNPENIKTGARLLYIITIIFFIIVIIIIIIISTINPILEEKEKATGWEGDFTNKTV